MQQNSANCKQKPYHNGIPQYDNNKTEECSKKNIPVTE